MTRLLKLTAFLSLWAIFFGLVGMVHLWISILGMPNRWKIISRLNRNLYFAVALILNIRVTVAGDEGQLERGGYVIIANHVSYIDGIVLGRFSRSSLFPRRKSEVGPSSANGTFCAGRSSSTASIRDSSAGWCEEMSRKLKQEANILLFPEGTSTNGEQMLPFQTVPLAAPLRSRSMIVPTTITYKSIDDAPVTAANRDSLYWYGDMDFMSHFWKLLGLRSVEVLVTIQPKIECFRYRDNSAGRKKLAEDCYNRVLGRVTPTSLDQDEESEEGGEPLLPA